MKTDVVALRTRLPIQESNTRRSLRRLLKHRMALLGVFLLTAVIVYVAVGSMIFSESDANFNNPAINRQSPSPQHPFGTDEIGRDILVRTIYGGQISLFIGVTSVLVQLFIGTLIGLVAGYVGGFVDALLMRLVEAILSIPQLFLALLAVRIFADRFPDMVIGGRVFPNTLFVIILVIGLTSWMQIARIIRATVLSLREQEFVTAARGVGASDLHIVFRHILPNCFAPLIVAATLGVAQAILLEAYLGFLGLGVRPPMSTWGNMLTAAYGEISDPNRYFMWLFPSLFVIVTVLGVNFLGDGLRDALDPRSSK